VTQKDPYILDRPTARRLRARDALICVAVAIVILLLIEGASIRHTGREMSGGVERTVVRAVGEPAGWVADKLPLSDTVDDMTGWLSPDDKLTGPGGFENAAVTTVPGAGGGGAPAPITPDYFDPTTLGAKAAQLPKLRKLLVTGDSMSQPLDAELARRLADEGGVQTVRDAHLGTAISRTDLIDWGALSVRHATKVKPDAVVMFIGANDAYPMPGPGGKTVNCCGPQWAALYASRVRRMMETYRRDGAARVYWLTLPMPRSGPRQMVARTVNAAIGVAAQPYRSQVRVLDMANLFTPGGHYRAAMTVDGKQTIVRNPDGIHLNAAGARLAAELVETRLRSDFKSIGG
jgi:lysophospholipase L1-like esterase